VALVWLRLVGGVPVLMGKAIWNARTIYPSISVPILPKRNHQKCWCKCWFIRRSVLRAKRTKPWQVKA
jgi:hypothetical protein